MMTPLIGFAPDADSTTPGVITDCSQLVPSIAGMQGAPSAVIADGVPELVDACQGAAVLTRMDNSRRIIAGTDSALYELLGGAWVNQSAAGGYSGGADSRWSLAQYGDSTVAANGAKPIQRSDSGAFAAISGAPVARIVFTVGAFVMALNTTEASDQWYCCAAYNVADWTTNTDTQCAKGRLVATNGPLTAGARLGEYAVAYKARSMYLGQYVGAPAVWQWVQIPGGEAGCIGQDAICDIGGAHFFVCDAGMFLFDGQRPTPVADGQVRQWFLDNSDPQYRYRTCCVHDAQRDLVWVFYPSKGNSTNDSALVWHIKSKMWGRADRGIEAALNYISGSITYDTLGSVAATYDTLPAVSYDSQYWLSGGRALSVFDTSHQLRTLTGSAGNSSFTTGDYGDDDVVSLLRRVRLRYAAGLGPVTANVEMLRKMTSGDQFTPGASGSIADGKFDVMQSARWHRARFKFTGNMRVMGMDADYVAAGKR